jgi:magnesium transporter
MIRYDDSREELDVEQVSLVLSNNWLFSFQENVAGDVFEAIRERIRLGRGRIRKSQVDYLLYALIDAIVDHYFVVLEKLGDRIELLEDTLIANPKPSDLEKLYKLKGQVYYLRRAIWPLREVVATLAKKDSGLLQDSTLIYIRDVYDHTIQVIDNVEMMRDILSELLDIYLSSVSYRMNAIMKVLTIITTIFMPLSFIAGVYGMNFEHMPELKWVYGYPGVLGLMTLVTLFMLAFFRRAKWI